MSKHFPLDNGVLEHRHGRNQNDNNQHQYANCGGGRAAQRQPGRLHPRLRARPPAAARAEADRRDPGRVPPHPLALPGAGPHREGRTRRRPELRGQEQGGD